jgi:hypothetical protein
VKNGRPKPKFRIRIKGYERKAASAFKFHPLNYRRHGEVQRDAVRTMLGDVGWVQTVIENKRTGNLIDGHVRIEEALRDDPKQLVPYLIVDLSEAEEKAVLATLDPITLLADTDFKMLDQLFQETIAAMPSLDSLIRGLHFGSDGTVREFSAPEGAPASEPVLRAECLIEIYCARADLKDFQIVLENWSKRNGVSIHVS